MELCFFVYNTIQESAFGDTEQQCAEHFIHKTRFANSPGTIRVMAVPEANILVPTAFSTVATKYANLSICISQMEQIHRNLRCPTTVEAAEICRGGDSTRSMRRKTKDHRYPTRWLVRCAELAMGGWRLVSMYTLPKSYSLCSPQTNSKDETDLDSEEITYHPMSRFACYLFLQLCARLFFNRTAVSRGRKIRLCRARSSATFARDRNAPKDILHFARWMER